MNVKWSALGEVALVSFGVGVAIVVIFSVGVLAASVRPQAADPDSPGGSGPLSNVAAGLCFLACVAIAAYGIYLIVPQFH